MKAPKSRTPRGSFVSKAEKGFVKLRSPGSIGIKFQPNPNVFSFDREGGENKTKFQGPSLNYATSWPTGNNKTPLCQKLDPFDRRRKKHPKSLEFRRRLMLRPAKKFQESKFRSLSRIFCIPSLVRSFVRSSIGCSCRARQDKRIRTLLGQPSSLPPPPLTRRTKTFKCSPCSSLIGWNFKPWPSLLAVSLLQRKRIVDLRDYSSRRGKAKRSYRNIHILFSRFTWERKPCVF